MLWQYSLHLQSKQTLSWLKRATVTLEVQHQGLGSSEVQLIMLGLSFLFSCPPSSCFASIFFFQWVPSQLICPRWWYQTLIAPSIPQPITAEISTLKLWKIYHPTPPPPCASRYSAVWHGFQAGLPFTCLADTVDVTALLSRVLRIMRVIWNRKHTSDPAVCSHVGRLLSGLRNTPCKSAPRCWWVMRHETSW